MNARKRLVQRVTISVLGVASIAAVALAAVSSMPTESRRSTSRRMTDAEAVLSVTRLGLDANAAAIAGISPTQLSGMIQLGKQHFLAAGTQFRDADAAVRTTRTALDETERNASSGRGGQEASTALASARSQFQSAVASRDALVSEAFSAVTQSLTAEQIVFLQRIASNRYLELPVEYLVLERDRAGWDALKSALLDRQANRQAVAVGIAVGPVRTSDTALTTADSDPAVVAARTALQNAPALEAVWQDAIQAHR